jgi:hypothetical protein
VAVPSQDSDVYVCQRGIEVSVPIQVNDVYVITILAWYRNFDTSLTHMHITILAWYRHFDTSLTHMHITRGIEVSVPIQVSDVYVC